MNKIVRYIHRPNLTELGMGNTNDKYLVCPESEAKVFFPEGVETIVYDEDTDKTYTLYSKTENNEFRVKRLSEIFDNYQMDPGDELIFTRYEDNGSKKITLKVNECGRIFLNQGKRENGLIKDFEIINSERFPGFNKNTPYDSKYLYMGDEHHLEISFSQNRPKRTDSPQTTDFYTVKYDEKELANIKNIYYYLSIRKGAAILKMLPKYELIVLLDDDVNAKNDKKFSSSKSLQQIFYGAPGTGKSHTIKNTTEQAEREDRVFRTTFHPDSDYSTFVGCYKPTMKEVPKTTLIGTKVVEVENGMPEEKIVYRFVPQAFTNAYIKAWSTTEDVYLIIEEINRGNCAQIFGDLFQLLDRGDDGKSEYPIDADTDLGSYIAKELVSSTRTDFPEGVKDGKKLVLPSNLYIWATMNTSDQSLFPIDSAFKRRWDWKYLPIEDAGKNWKIKVNGNEYDWYQFLEAINKEVFTLTHSEDKQLGYFFAKANNDGFIDAEKLVNKVYFYLWTDVFKDYDYESQKAFRKPNSNDPIAFKNFFEDLKNGEKVNEEMAEQVLINLELEKLNKPQDLFA